MAEYAAIQDVTDAYEGVIDESQDAYIQALLDLAEARLLRRVPSIPARVESGDLSRILVTGALVDIVLRKVRNPHPGYYSQQSGDSSYQLDRSLASGRIEIMPSDIELLLPPSSVARRHLRSNVPAWRLP